MRAGCGAIEAAAMSWTALVYCLVIIAAVVSLLLLWAWPRHPDGNFMSVEEAEELMSRFPRVPTGHAQRIVLAFFVAVGMIGVALTHHHDDDHDDDHH
jgi:hypothetical protein